MDVTVRFLTDRAELSASAAFSLNRVCREGPIRLTTLAAKEGVSQPSMTQLIQRLERAGLVTRLADPDDGRAAPSSASPEMVSNCWTTESASVGNVWRSCWRH